MPDDTEQQVEYWLKPYLDAFEDIPSVCMVYRQQSEVVLHLYLHLNSNDLLQGRFVDEDFLSVLKPMSVREAQDGQYLYWRHAFS
ncbi:MAG: hypothetical protein ACPGSC_13580, partial [Granulosicoccaceae bacterium]